TRESSSRLAAIALLVGLVMGGFCIALEWSIQVVRYQTLTRIAGMPPVDAVGEADLFEPSEELEVESSAGVIESEKQPASQAFSLWLLWCVIAAGGLASGVLVYVFAPQAAGAGTDAAVDGFHHQKGVIQGRVAIIKTMASAMILGTGGSAGREGPVAQIGASVGSTVARWFDLSARDRRILLAAGMGAGVGAMFRAPLAGALFAAEILYSDADMEADVIVPSAVASIIAYSVYIQTLPESVRFQPIFGGDLSHQLISPSELLPYALLGLAMLMASAAYVRIFHLTQSTFERLPILPHIKPAIGAAVAGTIGIASVAWVGGLEINLTAPLSQTDSAAVQMLGVLGTGYGTLQQALIGSGDATVGILIGVGLIKMATSSLSIGSGGAGGVFGPALVIGGCLGAAFGKVAAAIAPGWVPQPEAYAVVGMAGFFAGVSRTPISTIIMIRELTGDFALIVPTMLVSSLTFLIARRFTLYRSQVPTRMESPAHRGDFFIDVLEGLKVADVYPRDRKLMLIPESATLDEIVHGLASSNQHYFPVVNQTGEMVGIFTDDDVRAYLFDPTLWRLANAGDVMTSQFTSVRPDESLNVAMQKFTSQNVDELPVIDPASPGTLLGFLRRKETIQAYNKQLVNHRNDD
ncbi:MAG: chloride channel protein, partial [Planctomycetota bacterium]